MNIKMESFKKTKTHRHNVICLMAAYRNRAVVTNIAQLSIFSPVSCL